MSHAALPSGFEPLVPSQPDPRPTSSSDDEVFAEQNFFPSFFRGGALQLPPSRPFSNRPHSGSSYRQSPPSRPAFDESILGSGDFVVLRGGTFYGDGEHHHRPSYDHFGSGSSFHDSDHGRPFALPLESTHYSDDPFANFKDFADLTGGMESDFSHAIPVVARKNSTTARHEPNNILDTLEMIDEEKREAEESTTTTSSIPKPIKLSKFKSKLLRTKLVRAEPTKQSFKKSSNAPPSSSADYSDPLVADS